MTQLPQITLCADDFGLNPEVCRGIVKLAQMRKLSAVSCMVNLPDFARYAEDLLALKNEVNIGLHFNLTEGPLLTKKTCFNLDSLLIKTHLHLINPQSIAEEFDAQLQAFRQKMGCLPKFIDGHQHVHQFPIIRQVILQRYEQDLRSHHIAIRSTYPVVGDKLFRLKKIILAWSGGRRLSKELKKLNIPHNANFAGIYDFNPQRDYPTLFNNWLQAVPNNTLIMCHPGEGINPTDPIAFSRVREFNFFVQPNP